MKFVDVKNDVAFHKIFGNANKTITLISFLNAVLFADGENRVVSVTVENPYLFPPVPQGKTSILDVKATDQEGRKFIVELQIADKDGFDKRVQFYASREYSDQIERGDDYPKLRPTYLIGILDFNFTQNPSYFSVHQTMDTVTGEHLLKDVKYYFIELRKFEKREEELVSMVDKWTYFIKNASNLQVIPTNVDDEGLKTAYLDADQQTWTKAERDAYDDFGIYLTDIVQREKLLLRQGKEEGKIEGKIEGAAAKELEMIFSMYDAGLRVAQIASISSKTEEEVEAMIAQRGG
ncbi:MAG: Rpn family recombination-promoting nuclease/putative transposase [Bacteroidia bacterium]